MLVEQPFDDPEASFAAGIYYFAANTKSHLFSAHVWQSQAALVAFFNLSPKRQVRPETNINELNDTNRTTLLSLSQTRWTERYVYNHFVLDSGMEHFC